MQRPGTKDTGAQQLKPLLIKKLENENKIVSFSKIVRFFQILSV